MATQTLVVLRGKGGGGSRAAGSGDASESSVLSGSMASQ
jgi:hypothetical protein